MLCLCAYECAHHDDQQNILEVVSEAQSVAAEQSKVSLQELQIKTQGLNSVKFYCVTHIFYTCQH